MNRRNQEFSTADHDLFIRIAGEYALIEDYSWQPNAKLKSMTQPIPPTHRCLKPFSHPFNPRTAAMLFAFAIIICVTVLLADKFSPRDRHPILTPATIPATAP